MFPYASMAEPVRWFMRSSCAPIHSLKAGSHALCAQRTTPWAAIFFIFCVVIGSFMMLQLFLAILLSGLDEVRAPYVCVWGRVHVCVVCLFAHLCVLLFLAILLSGLDELRAPYV